MTQRTTVFHLYQHYSSLWLPVSECFIFSLSYPLRMLVIKPSEVFRHVSERRAVFWQLRFGFLDCAGVEVFASASGRS